jgi:histidinol-phosphate aminotransferase
MVAGQTKAHPVHGGLNLAELRSLGIDPAAVLDFSASINPLGIPSGAREVLQNINLSVYPDPDCLELRDTLAERHQVSPDDILIGNGSTELIHLIARAYLAENSSALIFAPTFGEYDAACHVQNVEAVHLRASESDEFKWNLEEAQATIEQQHPKLVFLCNPNNPTGIYLDELTVRNIARSTGGDGILVLDEAYISFVDYAWDSLSLLESGNVILLRSMTKDYALTGLRLGHMLARSEIVERVHRFQPSWSVNAAAQATGIASLKDADHLERGREAVRIGKSYLEGELSRLGLEVSPSAANFLLVKVGNAAAIRLALLRRSVCVRDCASFGLPDFIRIGVRKLEDCQMLVKAFAEVLANG